MKIFTRNKSIIIAALVALWAFPLSAESVTLSQCEQTALTNHPLAKQEVLLDLIEKADVALANAQYLPKLSVAGKASRQSDATSFSNSTLGISIDANLTQFQVVGEVSQVVFDGGAIKAQKNASIASSDVAKSQLAVNLESLKSGVREAYFSILYLDSQIEQLKLMQQELGDTQKKLTTYLDNGIVAQSDVAAVEVQQLTISSQILDVQVKRESAVYTLSQLTGLTFTLDTTFTRPVIPQNKVDEISSLRKEFDVYQAQLAVLDAQKQALNSSLYPKVSAYAQAGYSEPGLNMFTSGPAGWWIVGVRGSFSLDSYYTYGASKEKLEASKQQIETQIEQFKLNEGIKLHQKLSEIDTLEQQLTLDDQIIEIQKSIKDADDAKIATGTVSVADMISAMNTVTLAQLTRSQHEIQLLLAQSELSLIEGYGETQK